MYAFISSGTYSYLKKIANELKLENTFFLNNKQTTLLYAQLNLFLQTNYGKVVRTSPIDESFIQTSSFFHVFVKKTFPDQREKTFLQIEEKCKSLFNKENILSYKITIHDVENEIMIFSQWKERKLLNKWINSSNYKDFFQYLTKTNKHFLHDPYTQLYRLNKKDTE